MVRRYNPYHRQRANPFQNMDASPTPITLGYKPAVDPAVLQQNLQRADQRFNKAKAMPQSLIAGLNKTTTFDANRNVLADKYDQEIKDIQKTVQEEYGGDWAKASDFVLNRVNRLQGYLNQAEQDYKEYRPKQDAIWQAQATGKGIYGGDNLVNIANRGTMELDEKGNIKHRSIDDNVQFFDINKGKDQAYKDVSRALDRKIRSTGITIGNKTYDGSNMPVASQGTIGGMSDKEVMHYLTKNSRGRAIAQNAINTNRDFKLFAAQQLDKDPSEVANDPRAQQMFAEIVAGQTSLKDRTKQSMMNTDEGTSPAGSPVGSLLGRTETITGSNTVPEGQRILHKTGLADVKDIANVTEEAASEDPKLKPALEYKREISNKLDADIIKFAKEGDNKLNKNLAAQVPTALQNIPEGTIFGVGVSDKYAKDFMIDDKFDDNMSLKELMEDNIYIKRSIKPLTDVLDVETVGEYNKVLEAADAYQYKADYNLSVPSYKNFLEDRLENSASGKENINKYPHIEPNKKEREHDINSYIQKTPGIIPEEMKERLPEEGDVSDWDFGLEMGPDGATMIMHPTNAFSTDEDESEKKVEIPVRNLTPQVAFDLTLTGKMPSIWRDFVYRPADRDKIKASEQLKGQVSNPRGEINRKGNTYKLTVDDTTIDESFDNMYDALAAMYVLNDLPTAELKYMIDYPKYESTRGEKADAMAQKAAIYRNQLLKYKQSLESQLK